jgi:hypothetical protein
VSNPIVPARGSARDEVAARLPLTGSAARAVAARLPLTLAAARATDAPAGTAWRGPSLNEAVADAVGAATGVRPAIDAHGPDPFLHPAFVAVYARARVDQVVRALSARTNLVLSGSSAIVMGDGPVAEELTATATRIGMRVERAIDNPVGALRARLSGLATLRTADVPESSRRTHYVFATGEATAPLAASELHGIVVDASVDGRAVALDAAGHPVARPTVVGDADALVVAMPAPLPAHPDEGDSAAWRILDALTALGILTSAGSDDADAALARLILDREAP